MKKIALLVFILPVLYFSQELDATVTINVQSLGTASQDRLVNFAQDVQNYLNSNHFSGGNWEFEKIKCTFSIFFTTALDETHYNAQVSVTSLRPVEQGNPTLMLNIMDNNWEFAYEAGQSMYLSPDFDPLTDFLDFYAYTIIGLNEDSYSELGGSNYFTQALNIVLLGVNSSSSKGWDKTSGSYNRRGLIEDLLNEKFRTFREDYFDYHFNGLDIYSTNKTEAQKSIVKLISNLETLRKKVDISGILIKTFFDAKSGEIVNLLKDYPDKEIFRILRKVDPPHTSKYDEILYN